MSCLKLRNVFKVCMIYSKVNKHVSILFKPWFSRKLEQIFVFLSLETSEHLVSSLVSGWRPGHGIFSQHSTCQCQSSLKPWGLFTVVHFQFTCLTFAGLNICLLIFKLCQLNFYLINHYPRDRLSIVRATKKHKIVTTFKKGI